MDCRRNCHHDSSSSRIRPRTGQSARPSTSTTHTPSTGLRMPPLDRPGTTASSVSSTLLTPHDKKMASRQTQINSLSWEEKREQGKWAQLELQQPTTCAAGFGWTSVKGGYMCTGNGNHYVSHKLLAEGRGGVYQGNADFRPHCYYWYGPLYGRELHDAAIHHKLPTRCQGKELILFPGDNRPTPED